MTDFNAAEIERDYCTSQLEARLHGSFWINLIRNNQALKATDGEILTEIQSLGDGLYKVGNKRYHGVESARAAAIAMLRAEAAQ